MAHQIGQQRYVVKPAEKIQGETMPEGVGVNCFLRYFVFYRKTLQLHPDSPWRDLLSSPVAEDVSAAYILAVQPFQRLLTECSWEKYPSDFSPL